MTMKRSYLAAALVLSLLAISGSADAEDAVLVSSTVPDYVAGTIITEGQTLRLPDGASAILLFRSGAMIRLKGPFENSINAPPGGDANSVKTLVHDLRAAGTDASVIGASRAVPLARTAMQGQRVIIEPQRSAIYCIGPSDSIWLHRSTSTSEDLLRMRRGQSVREVAWTGGEIEWPSDLQIEDGDRFETLGRSGEPMATIIFRRLGPEPSETAWVADNMLRGCREQAGPALNEIARNLNQPG
jgi:hypothetical protein